MAKRHKKRAFSIYTLNAFNKKYDSLKETLKSGYFISFHFEKDFEKYLAKCKLCDKDTYKVMVPYNKRIFINQEFYWSMAAFDVHNYPFPGTLSSGRVNPLSQEEHNVLYNIAKGLWLKDLIKESYVHPVCSQACINVMLLMNQN